MKVKQDELKNEEQKYLFDVLMNRIQHKVMPYDDQIFSADLVFKIKVPKQKYIPRSKQLPLSAFIKHPSQFFAKAYKSGLQWIYKDMQKSSEVKTFNQVQVRNSSCFTWQKNIIEKTFPQDIELRCSNSFNGEIDSFILKFNALIYTLQVKCGFKLKSYMTSDVEKNNRQVYVLIWQDIDNIIKVADKHMIKKQIDYTQLDLFVNDPIDSAKRPMKINKKVQQQNMLGLYSNKQICRKLSTIRSNEYQLIEEVQPSSGELQKFKKYEQENQKYLIEIFENPNQKIQLSSQQKIYLFQFNRGKINPGCQKLYSNIVQQRKYFHFLKLLASNHGYKNYLPGTIFAQFRLVGKKKKFFDRLRSMLFYKQQIVSPFGNLSLFLKSERIKISYQVQNLNKLQVDVFALNDSFEKYGEIGDNLNNQRIKGTIKGGLNGKNLIDQWNPIIPWRTNIETLRNYLGQLVTYQILVKNHLILHFLAMSPLVIIRQIVYRLSIQPLSLKYIYKLNFASYIVFFIISIIIYNIFLELWSKKQKQFLEKYVEKQTYQNFLFTFNGPFIRNPVTDSVNEYSTKPDFWVRFKQLMFNILIASMLGLQVLFFYFVRKLIIYYDSVLPDQDYYIVSLPHLTSYFIFFVINHYLYLLILKRLFYWLTTLENLPTDQAFKLSLQGLQLIGPIDLLIIEAINGTKCFSQYCYPQFVYYIYSRFVVMFFFVLLKFALFIKKYISYKSSQLQEEHVHITDYFTKLIQFLKFIESQSLKKQCKTDTVSQTQSLLQHGLFVSSFPISSLLSFGQVLFDYLLERIIILRNKRRPICRPQRINIYSSNIVVNCWIILFIEENIQYVFQSLIEGYQDPPTVLSIKTMSMFLMIMLIIIVELISLLTRLIVRNRSSSKINQRQKNKYKAYASMKTHDAFKINTKVNTRLPLNTIFRAYNVRPKKQDEYFQSDEEENL